MWCSKHQNEALPLVILLSLNIQVLKMMTLTRTRTVYQHCLSSLLTRMRRVMTMMMHQVWFTNKGLTGKPFSKSMQNLAQCIFVIHLPFLCASDIVDVHIAITVRYTYRYSSLFLDGYSSYSVDRYYGSPSTNWNPKCRSDCYRIGLSWCLSVFRHSSWLTVIGQIITNLYHNKCVSLHGFFVPSCQA